MLGFRVKSNFRPNLVARGKIQSLPLSSSPFPGDPPRTRPLRSSNERYYVSRHATHEFVGGSLTPQYFPVIATIHYLLILPVRSGKNCRRWRGISPRDYDLYFSLAASLERCQIASLMIEVCLWPGTILP